MRRVPAATPLSETIAKRPMSPGRAHVRAAAQLHAEAGHRDDAHLVAVFLAEERHRAGGDRLLRRLHVGLHGRVLQHLLVDDPLDLEELLAREGAEVDEVEAQAIGRDERSRLLHVRAEHLAQRGMEQVRGGVVAPDRRAPRESMSAITGAPTAISPLSTRTAWTRTPLPATRDVADRRAKPGVVAKLPDVGHLAAALKIEGRLREHHPADLAG